MSKMSKIKKRIMISSLAFVLVMALLLSPSLSLKSAGADKNVNSGTEAGENVDLSGTGAAVTTQGGINTEPAIQNEDNTTKSSINNKKRTKTNATSDGPKVTRMELHEKTSDGKAGKLVANLMDGTGDLYSNGKINWEVETEYYLVVGITPSEATDDSWVSVNIPYWMDPVNMVGGSNWNVPGTSIEHTAIDKVVSYTKAGGADQRKQLTGAGNVVYHIKGNTQSQDVREAAFEISMKPNWRYYNGKGSQIDTSEHLAAACGLMDENKAGSSTDTKSSNITRTSTEYKNIYRGGSAYPSIVAGETANLNQSFGVKQTNNYANDNVYWDTFEFDLSWESIDKKATLDLDSIRFLKNYFGYDVDISNETTTSAHVKLTNTSNVENFKNTKIVNIIGIKVKTNSDIPEGKSYLIPAKNIKMTTYGDSTNYERTMTQYDFGFYVSENKTTPYISGSTYNMYDWFGKQNIEENHILGAAQIVANGPNGGVSDAQTIHVEYPKNAIIRAITTKQYSGDITIKVKGHAAKTYNIQDVTERIDGGYVIRNTNLGVGIDDSIESATFNFGKVMGGVNANNDYMPEYSNFHVAAWGTVTDNNKTECQFTMYNTGTDPKDANNKTVQNATSTVNPANSIKIFAPDDALKLDKTSMVAGDVVKLNGTYKPGKGGSIHNITSMYNNEPVFYLTLPEDFSYANFKIDGIVTEGKLVKSINDTENGVVVKKNIYAFKTKIGAETGFYKKDGNPQGIDISVDLLTKQSTNSMTCNTKDILQVGNEKYPVEGVTGAYGTNPQISDKYEINGNRALVSWVNSTFTVQQNKSVNIDNSIRISEDNGASWGDWMTYNRNESKSTRAYMNKNNKVEYKVTMKNQHEDEVTDVEAFIPVPKVGANFGSLFQDKPYEYDMIFTAKESTIPEGFSVEYLIVNDTYNGPELPVAGKDYAVTDDPAKANMIRLSSKGESVKLGQGVETVFDVTVGNDLGSNTRVKVNGWKVVPKYKAGGTTWVGRGSDQMAQLNDGVISGRVYFDNNGNGKQDGDDKAAEGVYVTATDSLGQLVMPVVTDKNGDYTIGLAQSSFGLEGTVNVFVANPDTNKYLFSQAATGTALEYPSSVVPMQYDHITGAQKDLDCSEYKVTVNAGLVNKFGSIELTKYDVDSKAALEGATFGLEVYNETDKNWESYTTGGTITTDAKGKAEFKNLPWGKYKAVETSPAAGYLADSLTFDKESNGEFTIDKNDQSGQIDAYNAKEKVTGGTDPNNDPGNTPIADDPNAGITPDVTKDPGNNPGDDNTDLNVTVDPDQNGSLAGPDTSNPSSPSNAGNGTASNDSTTLGEGASASEIIARGVVPTANIGNLDVPLYSKGLFDSWALLNLILCIAGGLLAIFTAVRAILRRNKEEDERLETNSDAEKRKRTRTLWMLGTAVFAVFGIIIFLLTEDTTNPMVFVDMWTIVNACAFAATLISTIFVFKKEKKEDVDNTVAMS